MTNHTAGHATESWEDVEDRATALLMKMWVIKKNRFWSGCASAATGRVAAMVSGDDTRLAKGGSGNGAADGGAAVHKLPNLIELLPARNT